MNSSAHRSEQLTESVNWDPGFVLTLVACLVGGFIGGGIVHQLHPLFAYTQLPDLDLSSPPELIQQHHDAAYEYRSRNYAGELAIIGLTLGLALGACASGSRRIASMLVGGVVGALSGAGTGFAAGIFVAKTILINAEQTLQTSMGLQTLVWGTILASLLWSIATIHGGVFQAIKYGVVGVVAGFSVALTQFVLSSVVFPTSNPLFLIPELVSERNYWLAAFPIIAALIIASGLSKLRPAVRSQEAEPRLAPSHGQ